MGQDTDHGSRSIDKNESRPRSRILLQLNATETDQTVKFLPEIDWLHC
jgi:hypothetical protein